MRTLSRDMPCLLRWGGAGSTLVLVSLAACGSSEGGTKDRGKAAMESPRPRPQARRPPPVDAATPAPRPTRAEPPTEAGDFGAQLRTTYDQIFCRGRTPDTPCRVLQEILVRFRKRQADKVRAFLEDKRPKDLPATLLYPFSGGDILSALIAFPAQTRFVLLSLEQAGSPEPLRLLKPHAERRGRERFLKHAGRLLRNTYSHTVDLLEPEGVRIPGLLPIMLLGLHAHGADVTGLRYFKITPEGRIDYFTRKELELAGAWPRKQKSGKGRIYSDPEYNQPFSHAEIRFRLPGDQADRVIQHIAADISKEGLERLKGARELLQGLEPHALLIKAASFLLWKERYVPIRELILAKATFFVADSSAPQPEVLTGKGFTLRAHGYFRCAVIASVRPNGKKWVAEFSRQRTTPIPFSFGYTDCKRNGSLILGYRHGAPPPASPQAPPLASPPAPPLASPQAPPLTSPQAPPPASPGASPQPSPARGKRAGPRPVPRPAMPTQ